AFEFLRWLGRGWAFCGTKPIGRGGGAIGRIRDRLADFFEFLRWLGRGWAFCRVEKRRAMCRSIGFRCIRPFELCGKEPPDLAYVSSSPSKIPYGGFSPVRLQTGCQSWRPSPVR